MRSTNTNLGGGHRSLCMPTSYAASFRVPRAFHVSPFNDRSGVYEFHCSDLS